MAEYKFVLFFLTMLFAVPAGGYLAAVNRNARHLMIGAMLFFSCWVRIHVNFYAMPWFRGTARGFEFTLVDIICFALILSFYFRRDGKFRFLVPGWPFYLIYLLLSWFSVLNSSLPMFSYFELWKMVRMYFFMAAMYNLLLDPDNLEFMLKVFGWIAMFIFFIGMRQKYLEGRYQLRGPFDHQNSMAMYVLVLGLIFLSCAYNRTVSAWRTCWYLFLFAISSLMLVFSYSRGGLVAYGVGVSAVLGMSLPKANTRKIVISVILALGMLAAGARVAQRVYERFDKAPDSSKSARLNLAKMAVRMANSHVFGVGINHFGEVASSRAYGEYWLEINQLPDQRKLDRFVLEDYAVKDRGSAEEKIYLIQLVETIYLLVAAECGWPTLIALLAMFGYFLYWAFRLVRQLRGTEWQFFYIGVAGALSAIFLQSTLEWVLKQSSNYYQLMILFGAIGAMQVTVRQAIRAGILPSK